MVMLFCHYTALSGNKREFTENIARAIRLMNKKGFNLEKNP